MAECSGNGAGKRRQKMAGSATQRGFTQRRLKVDVHEVAVVDVQAQACPAIWSMNFGHSAF